MGSPKRKPCEAGPNCKICETVRLRERSRPSDALLAEWRSWARAVVNPIGDPTDDDLRSEIDDLIAHGEIAADEARALVMERDAEVSNG